MTEAAQTMNVTAAETPRQAVARLRAEHTAMLARVEAATNDLRNLRNTHAFNLRQYKQDSPENKATLERAEQALHNLEIKLEDVKAELKKQQTAVAAEESAKNAQAARATHAAKIAALSEPQTPRGLEQVAAAEAALTKAQSEHSDLKTRVAALKEQAAKQDGLIKQNAREHAAALVAGTTPPELLPRIDYAEVLKACASELEASRQREAKAIEAVNGARNALAQAEASDAYAKLYAALAPIVETIPELSTHPSQWDHTLEVRDNGSHVSFVWYRPRHG